MTSPYDVVHSNSVIEHLYNFENQKKMASEIMRVGKKYIVQTPNKYFFSNPTTCFLFLILSLKNLNTLYLPKLN